MTARRLPMPDGSEVVDPGDGTEPYVTTGRKDGFWWVRMFEDRWRTAEVTGNAVQVVAHSALYTLEDVDEWGPYLGAEPGIVERMQADHEIRLCAVEEATSAYRARNT